MLKFNVIQTKNWNKTFNFQIGIIEKNSEKYRKSSEYPILQNKMSQCEGELLNWSYYELSI